MIKNTKIGILGAAKSGVSAAKLALEMGYKVILSDIDKSKEINIESNNHLTIELGRHSNAILSCDIIIISPGISPEQLMIKKAIDKGIPVISEIEFASWFTDSNILAVTGSNGKSTTVSILHEIFSESDYCSFLGGNIGTPLSDNVLIEKNTNNSNPIVHIVELSSFQTEKINKFFAQIGCILNISEDHLDRYQSMDEYINAKLNLVSHCESLFYDSNDKLLSHRLKNIGNAHTISSNNYFYIENQSVYESSTKNILFNLNETHLIGEHNLTNAFFASIIAKSFGVDNYFIREGILKFKPLPHRLEKVNFAGKINFYNDSKSTNIKSTLKALQSFDENVLLILGGRDKGNDFSDLINSLNPVDKIFCYGESGKAILEILKVVIDIEYINDFKECIDSVIKNAKEGQNILLSPACSSYDQFDNYEQRGDEFKNIVGSIYE